MEEDPYQCILLAYSLLQGFVAKDSKGIRHTKYLDKAEELQARKAIADLLRSASPLDRQLRDLLADFFDPDPGPSRVIVKLKIAKPRGGQLDHIKNTNISQEVWKRMKLGSSEANAIHDVGLRLKIDESAVGKIWRRFRKYKEVL